MKLNINNLDLGDLEEEPMPHIERFKKRSKVNKKQKTPESKSGDNDSYNTETKDRE